MAFAAARLIALRSALLIIFVASDPAPINAPTRNVGRLSPGGAERCAMDRYRTAAPATLSRRCAQMHREESLLQGGTSAMG
jgi:hypothetical protein